MGGKDAGPERERARGLGGHVGGWAEAGGFGRGGVASAGRRTYNIRDPEEHVKY